jgi:hypothetical protein
MWFGKRTVCFKIFFTQHSIWGKQGEKIDPLN